MGNALFGKFKEYMLAPLSSGDIKAVLVDLADYTPNMDTDQYLSDIPAGARVATSGNLSGKTSTNGYADSDSFTFSSVSGDVSEAIVLYKDTGVAATSPLIAYIDEATAGLPITPNGGDIIVDITDYLFRA